MRVAFRADASLAIGTGHVMRCLALADVLRARGADCIFLSREHVGHLFSLVEDHSYDLCNLGQTGLIKTDPGSSDYASWLGVEVDHDLNDTLRVLQGRQIDWLIVDHYGINSDWERAVGAACRQLLVIDDLGRMHHADALIDQNLSRTKDSYQSLVPPACHLMLGPNYALLRSEFAGFRARSLIRRNQSEIHRVLISMGGVDRDNATGAVLEALRQAAPSRKFCVTVVLGPTAPWRREVITQAAGLPFKTEVVVNARNMAQLMCEADLAVGAAGGTTWERCCLGLPTIQIVVAENQREIAQATHVLGAALLVERSDLNNGIKEFMVRVEHDPNCLASMASAASAIADGHGAERVADRLRKVLAA
jgi:UDP-2,4-diacetamido-2,4,6-trideoxy-beta-L-altropyranose hydrolase